ncbi:SDR family oxidoreductase [Zhongshania aquimaris]|uniref:SDR family oxidoreductase n=1 Tax=Zhongshania aquimaris TaxID=2857107 RepID=A0ABS6VV43_9GAMM|nr:SDR family oxidoreductase [Zhongshania aquimaris]MBW2942212.1 SDR family oxidoreductase [Zhongshania aquimaris]
MKNIIVTGSSSGFGLNTSIALAENGWNVFSSVRNLASADTLLKIAKERGVSERINVITMDVTDVSSVDNAINEIAAITNDQIDAVVNNAGYSVMGAFEDLSDAHIRKQMETNFFGTLNVTKAVLPGMRKMKRGRIVIVSSNALNTPHPLLSMYAASKWALEGWAEALQMEVSPFGLSVVVVQPGAHRTPFAENVVSLFPDDSEYKQWIESALPGISNLDSWGRDSHHATAPILNAVEDHDHPFRSQIGEDAIIFEKLRGAFPFELRAHLMRLIVGLPSDNQFIKNDDDSDEKHASATTADILETVGRSLSENKQMSAIEVTKLFGLLAK